MKRGLKQGRERRVVEREQRVLTIPDEEGTETENPRAHYPTPGVCVLTIPDEEGTETNHATGK